MRRIHVVFSGVVLFALAVFTYTYVYSVEQGGRETIRLATGSEGGTYHAFGRAFSQNAEIDIELVETAGSVENLELLRSGEVDFAVVQGDMAEMSAQGLGGESRFDDYAYVASLFPEYVQVLVPVQSGVAVLGDLRGTSICVGPPGSGTYVHANQILQEAGLRAGIDYFPVTLPVGDCLTQMVNPPAPVIAEEEESDGGEIDAEEAADGQQTEQPAEVVELGAGPIAATFTVSAGLVAPSDAALRQLQLSQEIASALFSQAHDYRLVTPSTQAGQQLAVQAYLLTNVNQPASTVDRVTGALIDGWARLRQAIPGQPAFDVREPGGMIEYHSAARSEFEQAGLLPAIPMAIYIASGLALAVVVGWAFYHRITRTKYDRLGNLQARKLGRKVLDFLSYVIVAIFIIASAIAAFLFLLLEVEDAFAVAQGSLSPFAQLDAMDAFVWMITYIGSGFTADNIYPASFLGKIIVAILAIAGIATPLGYMYSRIQKVENRKQRAIEGREKSTQKGHILICGWNEKASGIIYALTGDNIATARDVTIVANCHEFLPLQEHDFDQKRVFYCCGSPASRKALVAANAADASAVIVLADFSAANSQNKVGILAAMNAHGLAPHAHICAELEFAENFDAFRVSGCKGFVFDRLVAIRLATTALRSPDLVDYVFDSLTFNKGKTDRLFSKPVSELSQALGKDAMSVADLRRSKIGAGVNIVGVFDRPIRSDKLTVSICPDPNQRTIVDVDFRKRELKKDATIVYSAASRRKIDDHAKGHSPQPVESPQFLLEDERELSVCVVTGKRTLVDLEEQLRCYYDKRLKFHPVDLDAGAMQIEAILDTLPDHLDSCIILQTTDGRTDHSSMEDVHEADSDQILRTKIMADVRRRWKQRHGLGEDDKAWPIMAEITIKENDAALKSAGADRVLACSVLAERFLAKQATDKGHVTDFLMAAMNLQDSVHLHAHTVREGDGFCGERWDRLLSTQIDGARILAWRPHKAEELENELQDYGFHFRTVIDRRIASKHEMAAAGDIIILLRRRATAYENASLREVGDALGHDEERSQEHEVA